MAKMILISTFLLWMPCVAAAQEIAPTRYTSDIEGEGPLIALIDTSAGVLHCQLFETLVPHTVDNFVGLARGLKPFKNTDGNVVREPFYDGLLFFRVEPDFLIQSGDPTNTGMGNPGYHIEDEFADTLTFDQAGRLAMSLRHPHGGGSQFFITLTPTPQFNRRYPIFGQCNDLDLLQRMSRVPTNPHHQKPTQPLVIHHISFERIPL